MIKSKPSLTAAGLLALLCAAPAHASNSKSWVSNSGSDANACSLAQPCATFQRAHDQTAAGGEIGVLTPGDYGGIGIPRVSVTKSISITNDGSGEATILGSIGIEIAAGVGDIADLRGLVIDGGGTTSGGAGIIFSSGAAVHVLNCAIRNFNSAGSGGRGVFFAPTGNSQLFISDSVIFNNGNFANSGGIEIAPQGSGTARLVLDRVHVDDNVFGIKANGAAGSSIRVTVRDSVVSGNVSHGIQVLAGPGKAFLAIEGSLVVNNAGTGILADGSGAAVLLGDSTIFRNGAGVSTINGGQLLSYGNNRNNVNVGAEGVATGSLAQF